MNLQQLIQDACRQTEDSEYEVHFRNTYSGRGMYGSQCIGITGSHKACLQVIGQVIKNAYEDTSEEVDPGAAIDTLLEFNQDSMGYDVILYWPHLPSIDSAEELSDAEDEEVAAHLRAGGSMI